MFECQDVMHETSLQNFGKDEEREGEGGLWTEEGYFFNGDAVSLLI